MSAFFEYLRNITYYLMFATAVGMVAPVGKYRKFVSLVMGFILLAIMLAPLAHFSGDIPITQWFSGMPNETHHGDAETHYARWRNDYLHNAFEEQLRLQLKGMLAQNGLTVHAASFNYTDDFSRLTAVHVTVSRAEQAERRVPFIRIEPVQVNREAQAETCPISTDTKNLISEFYNLPVSHINVIVQN